MSQAMMDPAEVRQFANELKRFNEDIQNRMAALHARFVTLGETWHDQEHDKFAEEFTETMRVLRKFVDVSNRHAPYLMRKARRIDEYLDQH